MEIRMNTPQDSDMLVDLANAVCDEYYPRLEKERRGMVSHAQCGEILLAFKDGELQGFLAFVHVPDAVIERMLYVKQGVRGGRAAYALVQAMIEFSYDAEVDTILAGSSLSSHEVTKRIYQHFGFETNFTFRKELKPCVTQSQPS